MSTGIFKPGAMVCARKGCGQHARWRPIVVFRAPKSYEPCPPIRAEVDLLVCDACKAIVRLSDFYSPKLLESVQDALRAMGKAQVDPGRTTLDFDEEQLEAEA